MRQISSLAIVFLGFWINPAFPASTGTGFIHTVHTNHQTNHTHVYLEGPIAFNEPGCSGIWTVNSMDDTKFAMFTYPLLVVALTKRIQVSISVDGCIDGFPKIFAVDLVPR